MRNLPFVLLLMCATAWGQKQPGYLGSKACAMCHQQIAEQQSGSYMARTWKDANDPFFVNYTQRKSEGPPPAVEYLVASHAQQLTFELKMPERAPIQLPVEAAVGERRHGISFLVRLKELEGSPLPRSPLIAARYFHNVHVGGLDLNPGFSKEKPVNYETALGWILSPTIEKKCLGCHGAPQYVSSGETGVQCESCHGPGQPHAKAVAARDEDLAIFNPKKLSHHELNEFCGRCHTGLNEAVDPRPEDLLISNQTRALEQSECYIQSNEGFDCISCHDPHRNTSHDEVKHNQTCLSCHAVEVKQAAVCPVNATENCVSCHMPATDRPGFLPLVDHWIRVFPQKGKGLPRDSSAAKTRVRPRRIFLRILVVTEQTKANALRKQLLEGASFFDLAREHSIDSSRMAGGYLGEMWLAKMDRQLADVVAKLDPGEISEVVPSGNEFILFQRMPRDFRWEANGLLEEATRLDEKDQLDAAIEKYQQALRLNSRLLHALVSLATAFAKKGDAQALPLLEHAARLFPSAALPHFNLGIAYGLAQQKSLEIQAYKRAVDLDPDMVPAHVNLGLALASVGRLQEAAHAFQQAIQVNPLSARAHYNLGRIFEAEGKVADAKKHLDLAFKIDPQVAQ